MLPTLLPVVSGFQLKQVIAHNSDSVCCEGFVAVVHIGISKKKKKKNK